MDDFFYNSDNTILDLLREKTDQLEKELAETIQKLAEKEQELAMKDQRIGDLELKLKAQEKGFKDKMTYLNKLVAKYKRKAEESATQNADLLLESHRKNVMRVSVEKSSHQHYEQPAESRVSSASSSSSHSSSPRNRSSPKMKPALHPHAPKDPKDSRQISSGKHRQRTKIGTFEVPEGHPVLTDANTVKLRAASGRRLSGNDEEVIPDPGPFLQVTREQQKALSQSTDVRRQPSKPLPPISKSIVLSEDSHNTPAADVYSPKPPNTRKNPPVVPTPNKANSANFKKLKERGKNSPQAVGIEMQTLALEDITKSSVSNLRRAQEYGSD